MSNIMPFTELGRLPEARGEYKGIPWEVYPINLLGERWYTAYVNFAPIESIAFPLERIVSILDQDFAHKITYKDGVILGFDGMHRVMIDRPDIYNPAYFEERCTEMIEAVLRQIPKV